MVAFLNLSRHIDIPTDFPQAIWLQMLLEEGKNQHNETVIPAEVIRKAATGVTVYTPVACVHSLPTGIALIWKD